MPNPRIWIWETEEGVSLFQASPFYKGSSRQTQGYTKRPYLQNKNQGWAVSAGIKYWLVCLTAGSTQHYTFLQIQEIKAAVNCGLFKLYGFVGQFFPKPCVELGAGRGGIQLVWWLDELTPLFIWSPPPLKASLVVWLWYGSSGPIFPTDAYVCTKRHMQGCFKQRDSQNKRPNSPNVCLCILCSSFSKWLWGPHNRRIKEEELFLRPQYFALTVPVY